MFEFFFKYPAAVFSKGSFVFLTGWPAWGLAAAVAALGGLLAWRLRRAAPPAHRWARPAIWFLQTLFLALLLLLLWHPAISIASLKPQENIVAVLLDDSRSMSIREDGRTRLERATAALRGGLLDSLRGRFQVRLYRFGNDLERIDGAARLSASENATKIAGALRQVAAESTSLPIGAVVLLSDGAENAGGIDRDTIAQLRRRRIPVHTVGFGREHAVRDIEIEDASLPPRALPGSRLQASVTLRGFGYQGRSARLAIRDNGRMLASREISLKRDGADQTEAVLFNAGQPGARTLEISIDPLPDEENPRNNTLTRLVNVESRKPRILYIEGEPRWEYKFIRRAVDDDPTLQIASILRTTENKIYRQGIAGEHELEQGFPATAEELFAFDGLIIGSVASSYFTPAQQQLIRDFVDRRGGGVLFLGGRASLADGGYDIAPFSDLLPVALPPRKGTFHRDPAMAEPAPAGRDSIILRLLDDPQANAERWKHMPVLADYQELGDPKPGAVTLANVAVNGHTLPLLVTQNYGRGRTAVFATGGSWRWRMMQDHTDRTHEMFWQQLLRWLVASSPGPVITSAPHPVLSDDGAVTVHTEVRDKAFRPAPDAKVHARIMPESPSFAPEPGDTFTWFAPRPGTYVAEVVASRGSQELGRDVLLFRREDGVAESFHTGQNRELLEQLSAATGGSYFKPTETARLGSQIEYSEAGITIRETRDLWDMPIVFLLALGLRSAEWLLRRRWGVV